MEKDVYELETKGLCLFCLRECSRKTGADKDSDEVKAFKFLMRYLKVDILKLGNFSSSVFMSSEDPVTDTSMVVSLCVKCDEVVKKFQEYFMYNETIRLRMDECVQKIHDEISSAQIDLERTKEYEKRINTRNPMDLLSASVVENLRKETVKKCVIKINNTIPRVAVGKGTKRKASSPLTPQDPLFSPPLPGEKTATSTPEISQAEEDDEIRILGVVQKAAKTVDTRSPMNTCSPPVFPSDPSSLVEVVWNSPTPNSSPGSFAAPEFGITQFSMPSPWTPAPSPAPTPGLMEEGGDDLVFKCPICDRLYKSESSLNDCMRGHNLNLQTVNQHAEIVTEETNVNGKLSSVKILVCKLCRKICKNPFEFLQHHESTHADNNVTVTCRHCGIIYTEIFAFRKHVMMEHREVFFKQILSKHLPVGTTEQDFRIAVSHVSETMRLDPNCKAPYGCPHQRCNEAKFANRNEMEVHVIVHHFDLVKTKFMEDYQAKTKLQQNALVTVTSQSSSSQPSSSYQMNQSSNQQSMQQRQPSSNLQLQQMQPSYNHQSVQQIQPLSNHQLQQMQPSPNRQPMQQIRPNQQPVQPSSNYSMPSPSPNYFPPPNNSYQSHASNHQFQQPRPHQNIQNSQPPPQYRALQPHMGQQQQYSASFQHHQVNQPYQQSSPQSQSYPNPPKHSQALVHYRPQASSNIPTSQSQYSQHNSQMPSQPSQSQSGPPQLVHNSTHNMSPNLSHQSNSGHYRPPAYGVHGQGASTKPMPQINQLTQFVGNVSGHMMPQENWTTGNNNPQTQIRHSMSHYQGQNQIPIQMTISTSHTTNFSTHAPQYQGQVHNQSQVVPPQPQHHSQFTMQKQIQTQAPNQPQRFQTTQTYTPPHRSQAPPQLLPLPQPQVPAQPLAPPPRPQAPVFMQPSPSVQKPAQSQPPPMVHESAKPRLTSPPKVVVQTPPPTQAPPASLSSPQQQVPPKPITPTQQAQSQPQPPASSQQVPPKSQPPPPQQIPPRPQLPFSRALPLGMIKIDPLSEYD